MDDWAADFRVTGSTEFSEIYGRLVGWMKGDLVETAKMNDHEPYAWLRHVLMVLPSMQKEADMTELLPMNLEPQSLTYPV